MTYKEIPFTLEEWQKDPEGRKIKFKALNVTSLIALYFKEKRHIGVIWDDGCTGAFNMDSAEELLTLLIPVKTVRKWRYLYTNCAGLWHESKESAVKSEEENPYAIESAEFDEENNYIKGTVKVEEV